MSRIRNRMFCKVHQCHISITGCMKRQAAAQKADPTRAWREYNSVPFDPKCENCAQGKAIMKKYKDKKEALMEATTESRHQKIKADLDELETAARKRDSARAAARESQTETREPAAPATHPCGPVVEGKTCNRCDLVVGLDEAENYFHRSKNTKDGFEPTCKECRKKMARERRQAKKPAGKSGKPGRPKKTESKTNPKKAAAASPETAVEKVVTEKKDTIKKNDQLPDMDFGKHAAKDVSRALMDEMVRQVFRRCGYPNLYEALEKAAFNDMRPPHLQALYLIACALDPFGKVS